MSTAKLIGARLGGYEVKDLLGSGGMASVFRGFDPNLQRLVAIKVLSLTAAAMPGFTDRFRQEARLIANLRHPNIVHIYDFGEERGLIYMVQELLPGPTLEQRMADVSRRRARLASDEIITIITQLAGALDAAHAAGVIHRDVKPANALWNAIGALVLTDFGIAKNTVAPVNQTQAGMVMGTPTYMSPEQSQGTALTSATDIYSLGVVLYELIAGQAPFESPTPVGVLIHHIQTPPPSLHSLQPDLPVAVDAVVQRALAKDPAARFSSAGELAQALQRAWTFESDPVSVEQPQALHQQATQAWASRQSPPSPPPAPLVAPRTAPPPAPMMQHSSPRISQRTSLLLPILGALLFLFFACGAFLALRDGSTVAPATIGQGTTSPSMTTGPAVSAEIHQPSVITDPPPAGPVAELQTLFSNGIADGSIGSGGEALLTALNETQQALEQGDTATATTHLTELQQNLLRAVNDGNIPHELMRQAMMGINTIASDHGLTLPLSVESR
ncbi:MAG: serine/threonine protein kinase [Chloroflexales bacterium]|nr:serine/threonine protein kinase [Chloroflexales bacterium]